MSKTLYLLGLLMILPLILTTPVTVGDNQAWDQFAFSSDLDIGTILLSEVVTVQMSYTNRNSPTAVVFTFQLFAKTDMNTVLQTATCSSNPCTVAFPALAAQADVVFRVTHPAASYDFQPTVTLVTGINVAQINVFGSDQSRTDPQLVEALRTIGDYRMHRIYVAATTNVVVTAYYQGQDATSADSTQKTFILDSGENSLLEYIQLVPETANSTQFTLGASMGLPIASVTTASAAATSSDFTFAAVTEGFYWIIVDIYGQTTTTSVPTPVQSLLQNWNYRIEYKTQRYECPNDPDNYPDTQGIYQGCIFPQSSETLPCVNFSTTSLTCLQCLTGYTLSSGSCLVDPCPLTTQYRRYGFCYNNPQGCAVFDFFTNCTTCADTYALTNGSCTRVPLVCPDRTYFNETEYVCSPVSDLCGTYDSMTGLCLTCLSAVQMVDENGICIGIVDPGCTDRQYIDSNGMCIDVVAVCAVFEKIGGLCTACITGYALKNGLCEEILCPLGQFAGEFGNCKNVSPLCRTWDSAGRCLTCAPAHTVNLDGECLQNLMTNPCEIGFFLLNNRCTDNRALCSVANSLGYCQVCINGYFLLYTGECVRQVNCSQRQFIVNNQCYDVSGTCGNFDRITGKCINCINMNEFELYYGLCIPRTSCGVREWTDNNGDCHVADVNCRTFNPSNGLCTSCVSGMTFFGGICCPEGQFVQNEVCVAANSAQDIDNQNGCLVPSSVFGCLRCQNGYTLEAAVFFNFCQKA